MSIKDLSDLLILNNCRILGNMLKTALWHNVIEMITSYFDLEEFDNDIDTIIEYVTYNIDDIKHLERIVFININEEMKDINFKIRFPATDIFYNYTYYVLGFITVIAFYLAFFSK